MNTYQTLWGYQIRQRDTVFACSPWQYSTPDAALRAAKSKARRLHTAVGRNNVWIYLQSEVIINSPFRSEGERIEWRWGGVSAEPTTNVTPPWDDALNFHHKETNAA